MNRGIVWVWWMAMLLAVRIAVWPAKSRRSTDAVLLGAVIDAAIEEPPPWLTTIEAPEETISILRRGALVEIGGQQVESIQRPREVRRAARGPPAERRWQGV
jgi:hypothetical protein